jgi:hypothetical protein
VPRHPAYPAVVGPPEGRRTERPTMRHARISGFGGTFAVAVAAVLALGVAAPAHADRLVTTADQALSLVFAHASGQGDADGDGVPDASDICADTTFTAGPVKTKPHGDHAKPKPNDHATKPKPEHKPAALKPNHYWSTSDAGFVDRTDAIAYTLEEAGGCSAEQIIAAAGLGAGHMKHGISAGAMKKWVASLEK